MIKIIVVGKTKEQYIKVGMQDFFQRLNRFIRVDVVEVSDEKIMNDSEAEKNRVKDVEGKKILAACKSKKGNAKDSILIALDENGKQMRSIGFADYINSICMQDICFVIGGALGLSEEVLNEADSTLSLSKMTFNNQMVRLFFIEQLYRAFAINKGIPYHK